MAARKTESLKDFKTLLRERCLEMIIEEDAEIRLLNQYKKETSFPFDFYNSAFRESESSISAIRELYRRVSGEDLQ